MTVQGTGKGTFVTIRYSRYYGVLYPQTLEDKNVNSCGVTVPVTLPDLRGRDVTSRTWGSSRKLGKMTKSFPGSNKS